MAVNTTILLANESNKNMLTKFQEKTRIRNLTLFVCTNSDVVVTVDYLCGLVVRVLGYRSRSPGSIPGPTNFLRSSGSGTESTQPREYNLGAPRKKM
jgi:hypothetical protein